VMLEIRPIMNILTEEIFEFKSCSNVRAFDLNLEIHVTNRSDRPVGVPSYETTPGCPARKGGPC